MRTFLLSLGLAGALLAGEYHCRFAPDGWQTEDWLLVKSPRWPHRGTWIQETDGIRNATPPDATPEDMLGKRAGETYTSMVLRKPCEGNLTIEATMSFDHRMAPLVVLAPELGQAEDGYPEYREHWEIVLFDEGVNIWHHTFADGKPAWRKAAYARFAVEPGTMHRLTIRVQNTRNGREISVRCGENHFGYLEPNLPERLHVGLTGCEGVNRFHSFAVETGN
jgi:hypothetical protein